VAAIAEGLIDELNDASKGKRFFFGFGCVATPKYTK